MGIKLKRFKGGVSRPFKSARRIGSAIGGMFKAPDYGSLDDRAMAALQSITRQAKRQAGGGQIEFTEQLWA